MDNNVVITSWSATYGTLNEIELTQAAFNDEDIVHLIEPNFNQNSFDIPKNEAKLMGSHAFKACVTIEQVLRNANLWQERNLLRGKGDRFRHPRAAIVAGSSLGMIDSLSDNEFQDIKKLHPYTLSKLRGNSIAAPLAIRFGFGAGDFSLSAASATGGQAIWLAAHLIKLKVADIVVVVGSDISNYSKFTKNALEAMGTVATSLTSRPLCEKRTGMRPVCASAALVLESETHALERGIKPMARWTGGAIRNDCHHLLAPEPKAQGLEEAVRDVLTNPSDIDWLSLHATGTKTWDVIESQLVKKIFHHNIPHISAFKRTFGHALGSGCLLSIAMIAQGLANKTLPKLPSNIDPALELNLHNINKTMAKKAMNWSVGMGGSVAVNLFEAYENDSSLAFSE